MNGIDINDLKISYTEKTIINGLNLNIEPNKKTAIIGPNGCGKSTLLKSIGRIISRDKGSITINGRDILTMDTKELAKKMAILPQSPIAPEGITVKELISYGRFPHQKGIKKLTNKDIEIIENALSITNLKEMENKTVEQMSGGQRQRVWIAMALAQESEILLLDEPTTYLDMAYQLDVMELLDELNRNHKTTIVMVLHDLNMASRFADNIIAIKDGSLIAYGNGQQVINKEILKTVYDIDANLVKDPITGANMCLSYNLLHSKHNKLVEAS